MPAMPAEPIGDKAMTEAERQARYRAAHAAGFRGQLWALRPAGGAAQHAGMPL